jgi:hypothetical protein
VPSAVFSQRAVAVSTIRVRASRIAVDAHTSQFALQTNSSNSKFVLEMKVLMTDYAGGFYATTKASIPRGRRALHDPWPIHGNWQYWTIVSGISGLFYPVAVFGLKDGLEYNYFAQPFADADDAVNYFTILEAYPVFGLSGGYQGEGFNHIMRSAVLGRWVTDLADPTAFENWYLTH